MKIIKCLQVICMLTLGMSCSEPEIDSEELMASNYRFSLVQQSQYLNGLDLYRQAAVVKHFRIKREIAELKEAIDGGEKDLLSKLEAAQQKEAALVAYKTDLVRLQAPMKYPPRPPRGCWEDPNAGCIPKLDISDFGGIEIIEGLEVAQIEIRDSKDRVVGKGGKVSHTRDGLKVMAIEADFKGEATLYITPKTELRNINLVLEVPVSRN